MKPSCWVVTACVDALGGADQRDAQPLQLIQDQGQVRQRSAKPVQFVHDHPGHLAGPDLAHHGVELWPGHFGPGLMLDEEPDFQVASGPTKSLQLLSRMRAVNPMVPTPV